jgi:hypothetical protein
MQQNPELPRNVVIQWDKEWNRSGPVDSSIERVPFGTSPSYSSPPKRAGARNPEVTRSEVGCEFSTPIRTRSGALIVPRNCLSSKPPFGRYGITDRRLLLCQCSEICELVPISVNWAKIREFSSLILDTR